MTTVESDEGISTDGLGHALRRMRDPVLLLLLPLGFAALDLAYGHGSVDVGFDFRGTLWEPARALLDGAPMYPEPTRASVEIGNPAVYPPFAILLTAPLAFLSASAASWVWFAALAAAVLASMWIVGVRDWRCLVLGLTSPVVLQGLYGATSRWRCCFRSHWRGAIASGRRSWESIRADSSRVAPARSRMVLRLRRLARGPASQADRDGCARSPTGRAGDGLGAKPCRPGRRQGARFRRGRGGRHGCRRGRGLNAVREG